MQPSYLQQDMTLLFSYRHNTEAKRYSFSPVAFKFRTLLLSVCNYSTVEIKRRPLLKLLENGRAISMAKRSRWWQNEKQQKIKQG